MKESYDDKRESIKKAGLQVFTKYGYYKTTLDDIADTVGIKKNSLYYYFPNKESLFEEIVGEESVKMINSVLERVDQVADHSEKVMIFFKEFLCYGRNKRSDISISMETLIEMGLVIEEHFHEIFDSVRSSLASILKDGMEKGNFKQHDSSKVAEILIEFVTSYEREQVRKNKNISADELNLRLLEEKILGLVSLVVNGIVKR